ncbi:MAG TPA: hypothetical protein VJ327_06255 [Patescibacteria group bacterium]|nr:hypothetical protein [Patescibacteria group bacterium]
MEIIRDIKEVEAKILEDIKECIRTIKSLTEDVENIDDGIKSLRDIRSIAYENMNQIQHEHLVLRGTQWLRENGYQDEKYEWSWNPRQTGDASEPDLMAKDGQNTILCAEATTSENPVGVIDSRMRDTLEKLSKMNGKKVLFCAHKANGIKGKVEDY